MKAEIKAIAGQKSWIVKNENVELALTQKGGHMAPVFFYNDSKKPVQPYYINPWTDDNVKSGTTVVDILRGDFFCMPFGADNNYKKESHGLHGEPAYASWKNAALKKDENTTVFSVKMDTKVRSGTITKILMLKQGHNAVYSEHRLQGYSGKMTIGHHPTLAIPEAEEGMLISTAPIKFGLTTTRSDDMIYGNAEEYSSLASNAKFNSLKKVPTVWKDDPYTDCSSFPKREGFSDIFSIIAKPGKKPYWTAASVPSKGYLWFSLKDPNVLPSTVFWMSNKGRHVSPWNGRNMCLGLEDICGYLAEGLAASAKKNPLTEEGVPTVVNLSKTKPFSVRHIQGVVRVPKGFDRVKSVGFEKGKVRFVSESGREVTASLDWDFIEM